MGYRIKCVYLTILLKNKSALKYTYIILIHIALLSIINPAVHISISGKPDP